MTVRLSICLTLILLATLDILLALACEISTYGTGQGRTDYDSAADGYLAVAPEALRSGQANDVSVSLFQGVDPAQGTVQAAEVNCTVRALSLAINTLPGLKSFTG